VDRQIFPNSSLRQQPVAKQSALARIKEQRVLRKASPRPQWIWMYPYRTKCGVRRLVFICFCVTHCLTLSSAPILHRWFMNSKVLVGMFINDYHDYTYVSLKSLIRRRLQYIRASLWLISTVGFHTFSPGTAVPNWWPLTICCHTEQPWWILQRLLTILRPATYGGFHHSGSSGPAKSSRDLWSIGFQTFIPGTAVPNWWPLTIFCHTE
jgi:hypothetical protein